MTISYALHKRHFSLMYRRQILAIKQLDMPNSKYEKFILVVSTLRKSTFFRMTHTRYPLITCTTFSLRVKEKSILSYLHFFSFLIYRYIVRKLVRGHCTPSKHALYGWSSSRQTQKNRPENMIRTRTFLQRGNLTSTLYPQNNWFKVTKPPLPKDSLWMEF